MTETESEGPSFQKEKKIGDGRHGRIYLVREEGKEKVIKRNIVYSECYQGTCVNIREIDICLRLKNHPFCIQIEDVYLGSPFRDGSLSPCPDATQADDGLFFSMEKGSLNAYEWFLTKPNAADKKKFMVQILLAMEFLHSRNIYHRDLKPDNIIVFLDEKKNFVSAKISDFGISQYYSHQAFVTNNVVTPYYRAPEICLEKSYDLKSDLWSVGVIFFEMWNRSPRIRLLDGVETNKILHYLFSTFAFSALDLTIYQLNFPHDGYCQPTFRQSGYFPDLIKMLNWKTEDISEFNSQIVNGKFNQGTDIQMATPANYANFLSLMKGLLMTDPDQRSSASAALNHPFFQGYRYLIESQRNKFSINSQGRWILGPISSLKLKPSPGLRDGIKIFEHIYNYRERQPISLWYNRQMFFHAIDFFYRLSVENDGRFNFEDEEEIYNIIFSILIIMDKYFRVLIQNVGVDQFFIWGERSRLPKWRDQIRKEEKKILEFVFNDKFCQGSIYHHTIYEEAGEILSEAASRRLLEICFSLVRQESSFPLIKEKDGCEKITVSDLWFEIEKDVLSYNKGSKKTISEIPSLENLSFGN